jgi:hypothetical protein
MSLFPARNDAGTQIDRVEIGIVVLIRMVRHSSRCVRAGFNGSWVPRFQCLDSDGYATELMRSRRLQRVMGVPSPEP